MKHEKISSKMIITWPPLPKSKAIPQAVSWSVVLDKFKADLLANGRNFPGVYYMDKLYNLYPCADINRVKVWAEREVYSAPKEAGDCDNSAEHYSYFLHRALWSCPVIQITGMDVTLKKAHRFCVAIGSDGIVAINNQIGYWYKLSNAVL